MTDIFDTITQLFIEFLKKSYLLALEQLTLNFHFFSVSWLISWSAGWLIGWLVVQLLWLIGWLAGWLVDWLDD